MVRTQIQLTQDQHRKLKRWAARLGISLAEAVRRCVADRLGMESKKDDRRELIRAALEVCGKYADPSGTTSTARQHDKDLAEAYRR
jgi:hypothetical protein